MLHFQESILHTFTGVDGRAPTVGVYIKAEVAVRVQLYGLTVDGPVTTVGCVTAVGVTDSEFAPSVM
jgi:hypothetical protein